MQLPENFHLKTINVLKIIGLAFAAIIIIALTFRLIGSSFNSLFSKNRTNGLISQESTSYDAGGYDQKSVVAYESAESAIGLSLRNVITPASSNASVGDDAEEFEVTQYAAQIETRHLEDICKQISDLKSREDIIFENTNEYEKGCNYDFKVKHDSAPEVLSLVKKLDPKELRENTYTIKKLVDDYTSEVEILEKKIEVIEKTLGDAVKSYDELTRLATRTQDVESLAKIIGSKISIIERLTQERVNINVQLERLGRAKAEQLDRLDYVYFQINVIENKFIDGQALKDSWKSAIKSFVRDVNKIFQDITISLVALLFAILQYAIYFFILLVTAKYVWRLTKYIWRK